MNYRRYLYELFKYIEHNPIKAKLSQKIGDYPYTLLATLLKDKLKIPSCALNSKLIKEIKYKGIQEFLEYKASKKDLEKIDKIHNTEIIKDGFEYKYKKQTPLKEYFKDIKTKEDKNKAIIEALKMDTNR